MTASRPDIGFIPTPADAIVAMLKLADLSSSDVVYDLGCGDGRLLIRAALDYGVRGVGVDVDAALLRQAQARAEQEGVGDRLTFQQKNLFETDLRNATVVFIYLLPHLNLRLRPRLQTQLQPGSRIITHMFDMGDWLPHLTLRLEPSEEDSVLYLWRVP
ncbi:SAM-dependent methyltransferase [Phormidium tenue]|uniref:SAM-dependent methyltransferase n=1 Tax=Phormidium tenue NIES-30 TaxID=549789 RepID=A0A1U7J988_9CYAN|nr:class I SAM-dependent methyltransferase [Phormidium tenue]MBD2230892.1 class I SAM-dependent methyltransferase [Phormidium tenue FACHB-1052]OKH50066.1 SAM-dependent methyltransferase [Phormidium tenue NIES-30]